MIAIGDSLRVILYGGTIGKKYSIKLNIFLLRIIREARIATGLITGHYDLRKHLRTMGIYEGDPICKLCGGDDKTAAHIIFSCEALAARRFNLFGYSTLPKEAAWGKTPVKELLELIKGTGLLD